MAYGRAVDLGGHGTVSCEIEGHVALCATPYPLDPSDTRFNGGGLAWRVRAERPGRYTVAAAIVEQSAPDPDPANNQVVAPVSVLPQPVTASAVALRPATPRAGQLLTASVRTSVDGVPARPARVSCAAAIGTRKLAGRGRTGAAGATCTYRPPRAAAGKLLRGRVSVVVGTMQLTRRFAVRLG